MSVTIDLEPAADRLAAVISAVRDDQLNAPTPCSMSTLGDLVDPAGSFSVAFTAAARKDRSISGSGTADASRLGDWRSRIPQQLAELAAAWKDPGACEGMTAAAGLDLPAAVAGRIALDEIVLHGWDIARASGRDPAWSPTGSATRTRR